MESEDVERFGGGWDPRRVFEFVTGIPAVEGNSVTVLRNGDEIFPAMLAAARAAERSIDLLTFVYWTGDIAEEFAQVLAEASERSVRVRVLLDAVGARQMEDHVVERMQAAGCQVEWFRPVDAGEIGEVVHRTHRKVLVCDEEVAFTGGVGIADEWTGDAQGPDDWRDTHFEIRGPAVVGLRASFLQEWIETGRDLFDADIDRLESPAPVGDVVVQVLTDGDQTGYSATALAFHVMLSGAERRLRICTAYFTPDDDLCERICATARRGVAVEVLVPGEHCDKRLVRWAGEATFAALLEAGVKVWTFDTSMLHAKIMTADGRVALVGSSNVNGRSVSDDDEVLMAVFDERIVAELDGHFEDDLGTSTPLDLESWEERGLLRRAASRVAGSVSDLL